MLWPTWTGWFHLVSSDSHRRRAQWLLSSYWAAGRTGLAGLNGDFIPSSAHAHSDSLKWIKNNEGGIRFNLKIIFRSNPFIFLWTFFFFFLRLLLHFCLQQNKKINFTHRGSFCTYIFLFIVRHISSSPMREVISLEKLLVEALKHIRLRWGLKGGCKWMKFIINELNLRRQQWNGISLSAGGHESY